MDDHAPGKGVEHDRNEEGCILALKSLSVLVEEALVLEVSVVRKEFDDHLRANKQ